MDVCIDTTRSKYLAFSCNHLRSRADDDVHLRLGVGISRLTNCSNTPVFYAHISFDDPPIIHNECIRNNRIDRLVR